MVAIELVQESPLNPRKTFDQAKLAELADNIRKRAAEFGPDQAVISPLIGRPVNGHYELAAGHRRRRASEMAGLVYVPLIIREMSDQEFLEVLTIDNLQHEDVHPLEESDGYHQLINTYGYTHAMLADRVGRTESYISKRLALSGLIPELRDEYLRNNIDLGHALLLCRLEPKDQKKALDQLFETVKEWDGDKQVVRGLRIASVSEMRMWVEGEVMLDLRLAAWPKDDAGLVTKAPACMTCTKRTGANLALFDDTKKGDHCLDRGCFNSKAEAFVARTEKQYAKEGTPLAKVSVDWRTDTKGVLTRGAYVQIEDGKKSCSHAVKALMLDGPKRAHVVDICHDPKCSTHFKKLLHGSTPARAEKSFEEIWKDRRANLNEKVLMEGKRELWRAIVGSIGSTLTRTEMNIAASKLISRAGADGGRALCSVLGLEVIKGSYSPDFGTTLRKHLESLEDEFVPGFMVGLALYDGLLYSDEDLKKVGDIYGLDSKAIYKNTAAPMIKEFEDKKAKAAAAEAKKKKPSKKGKKAEVAAKQKPDRKRAAAGDDDGEE